MPEGVRGAARLGVLLVPLLEDAVDGLAAHWRQNALTFVGLAWGATAVILLLSVGAGFNRFLDLGYRKTGDRYTYVAGAYTTAESGGAKAGRRIKLTNDDLARVRAGASSAALVAGQLTLRAVAVETAVHTRANVVYGATPELASIENHRIARGRWLAREDEARSRKVAVIGANLVPIFFANEDPLGSTLQIEGVPFAVVGVLAPKGFQLMTYFDVHDNMVYVPLSAGQRLFDRGDDVDVILVNPRRLADSAALKGEIFAALAPFHRVDPTDSEAFHFRSVPEIMRPVRLIGLGLQVLLGFIGTVTLGMAGVGVANLMIALVSDRRRELATRRACGARRSDVLLQILVESVMTVLGGGGFGVAFGLAVVLLLRLLPLPEGFPPPPILPSVFATTFLVLVGLGITAGVAPARIASRVDPATAMRMT
jgi:putative ABC transport system permease protein